MKRLDASVCGHVQGVSYRYYASREAKRLKLTGWVRNERDGSVTVVAEGKEESLNEFLEFLRQGPSAARVSSVASKLSDREQEFATFDIRWA
jgi:acylphosphatase